MTVPRLILVRLSYAITKRIATVFYRTSEEQEEDGGGGEVKGARCSKLLLLAGAPVNRV